MGGRAGLGQGWAVVLEDDAVLKPLDGWRLVPPHPPFPPRETETIGRVGVGAWGWVPVLTRTREGAAAARPAAQRTRCYALRRPQH
jgi:hypothetical protein